jgi:glycosyltransferase involved in cell wall biosynthesis
MRIGIDAQFADYQLRGIGKYILHLVAGLPEAGPQHEYVIYGPERAFPSVSGRPNVRFRSPGSLPYPVWEQCLLPVWARQDRLDVLHCPANTMPLLLSDRIALVVTVHDVMYLLPPEVFPTSRVMRQRLGNMYRRMIVPSVPGRAAAILTVSEFSKSEIVRLLRADAARVHVTYSVNLAAYDEIDATAKGAPNCFGDRKLTEPYIFALGALDPRKNTEMIVRVYASVRDQLPAGEKLVIAGLRQWRSSRIYALACELQVQDDVFFADYVPEMDLRRLYQGARCFLFLSMFEGFGLPVIEAMIRGVPVVASNTSCTPEIVGDAGLVVDPTSLKAISDAVLLVLRNHDLRRRLSERGKARATMFRGEEMVRTTLGVYEESFAANRSASSAV